MNEKKYNFYVSSVFQLLNKLSFFDFTWILSTYAPKLSAKQYKGQTPISIYKRNGDKNFTFSLTRTFEIFYFCSFILVLLPKAETVRI